MILELVSELVSELVLKLIGDPDGCPLTFRHVMCPNAKEEFVSEDYSLYNIYLSF